MQTCTINVIICAGVDNIKKLLFNYKYDDLEILNALAKTNSSLGQLEGMSKLLPNPNIILNAITIGEAKESSEIENIVTTFDAIFKEISIKNYDTASKEVINYRQAILYGYQQVINNGYISSNMIEKIHHIIEPNIGGIRKIPGTVIINTKNKEIVHNPPQSENEIREYLTNLENYINYDELENVDPLIKMAFIHSQFESIHPFYDGNGRTGRIINVLYLVLKNKISMPIIYLSKYINKNRNDYYNYLSNMNKSNPEYKDYLLFMLKAIDETSLYTIEFINGILKNIDKASLKIKESLPKIYSKELVEYIFYDFYTKNEYIRKELNISRNTASKYLHLLVDIGILIEEKVGKETLFKNAYLYELTKIW